MWDSVARCCEVRGFGEVTTPCLAVKNTGPSCVHVLLVCRPNRPWADDGLASIFGAPRGPEELRLRQPGGFPEVSLADKARESVVVVVVVVVIVDGDGFESRRTAASS